jgi:hypothetical protein
VQLSLPPLLEIYSSAVQCGDSSLANLVGTMDRSSVYVDHAKFFDLCLRALDLCCQHPVSVQNIDVVEKSVINAMIALTMNSLRPCSSLFLLGVLSGQTQIWKRLQVQEAQIWIGL